MKFLVAFCPLLGVATSAVVQSPGEMQIRNSIADVGNSSHIFAGRELKMLPLGASITYGYHSSSGDGYRENLKQMLAPAEVDYIGTQCSGTMRDGNNEGHPGFVISQMKQVCQPDLPQKPNVVLIYVGTNDMVYPVSPLQAPQRMAALVQYLAQQLPSSLLVVGNLFLDTDPTVQARIETFNKVLPSTIASLQKQGINTVMADFATALNKNDLHCDGEHPNDIGYEKMAWVFYEALVKAQSQGRIHSPAKANTTSTVTCHPLQPTPTGTCTSSSSVTTTASSSAHKVSGSLEPAPTVL